MGIIIRKISNHEKVKEATLRFFAAAAMILLALISAQAFILKNTELGILVSVILLLMVINFIYYHLTDRYNVSVHILIVTVLASLMLLYFKSDEISFALFFYFTFPAIAVILSGNKYGTLYSIIPFLLSLLLLISEHGTVAEGIDKQIIISIIFSFAAILGVVNFNEYLRRKWHESYREKMAEKNKYIIKISGENQETANKRKTKPIINTLNSVTSFSDSKQTSAANNVMLEKIPNSEDINSDLSKKIRQIQKENIDLQQTIEIISEQQSKINEITKGMRDSLNYARTIQDAMLPSKETMKKILNEYFIMYYPKEVVSGDFYYVNKTNEFTVAAVADCTGHGVPGGFLTMLGTIFLHQITENPNILTTGAVLNQLREKVKEIFSHFGSNNSDGLDIAIIAINNKTNEMQYSGAFNPLIIINQGKFTEYKATRNPIGFYPVEEQFKTKTIELKNNDMIYLFSDGFADQPGGSELKRFSSRNFKETLYHIHASPVEKQEAILENIYKNWRGSFEQIDDVCVMGIKWTINNSKN